MSPDDVVRYMGPLAEALDYAHASQILHRDMKPGNVLINDNEQPILADFGLARMLESSTRFTQAQQALGTPEYMAPEQAMGAEADHRADLYSLGIMAYQMFVGQTPFQADTPAATLLAHIHQNPPAPRIINPALSEEIELELLKATAKEPDDRFQSATEMVLAFAKAGGVDASAIRAVPPPPRPTPQTVPAGGATAESPRRSGATRWLLGAAGAVAIGVIAALAFFLFMGGDEVVGRDQVVGRDGVVGRDNVAGGVQERLAAVESQNPEPPAAPQLPADTAAQEEVPPVQADATANEGDTSSSAAATVAADPCASLAAPADADAASISAALAQLQAMQKATQTAVVNLRDISDAPNVATSFRTREELCDITLGFYRRRDVRDQIFEAEELYKTLGLMAEDQSLERILLAIQLQHVSALVDDVSGDVYVLSDATEITPRFEVGYAAAYMGGLQQALFDVTALRDEARQTTGDGFRAASALIDGDVAVVTGGYISEWIGRDAQALEQLQQPIPDDPIASAPAIVRKTVLFPVIQGRNFVTALYAATGTWDSVNQAYADPPQSSEQVLHPERYFAGESPESIPFPELSELMSRGWSDTATDSMGEFLLRSYLEEHLEQSTAAAAADGWGGDQYLLMSNPEQGRLMVGMVVFDTLADADEFYGAFKSFMTTATEGTTTQVQTQDAGQLWATEDAKTVFLGESPPGALIIVGDDPDAVLEALGNFGTAMENVANDGQARLH